jgi:hypothetical protein
MEPASQVTVADTVVGAAVYRAAELKQQVQVVIKMVLVVIGDQMALQVRLPRLQVLTLHLHNRLVQDLHRQVTLPIEVAAAI